MAAEYAATILDKYTSTVFDCGITTDARYIRCDFKSCTEHVLNKLPGKHPTHYWCLNTVRNVGTLAKHVSYEIYNFIKSLEEDEAELNGSVTYSWSHNNYELNATILEDSSHSWKDYDKLLVVFNLRDPQSSFGKWINLFLSAVKNKDNIESRYRCITLSFASRQELLRQVCRLHSISSKNNNLEVMVVLSCHSSSQGQVFSCTPISISKLYDFEEFCSVHDFVCACQDVLKDQLKFVHISSCFAMKLNASHKEWPVDYTWYKTDLQCILSGSTKEIYETGSQSADLFIVLNTILSEKNMALQFDSIIRESSYLFPDLFLEMGLSVADPLILDSMMENPNKYERVTKMKIVNSSVHLVIIYSEEDYTSSLKDALLSNLQNRFSSDVKSDITLINITEDADSVAQLLKGFNLLVSMSRDILFLLLGRSIKPAELIQTISSCQERLLLNVYGIHITSLKTADVSEIQGDYPTTITAFLEDTTIDNEDLFVISSRDTCPVLLYMVHLCLGENGNVMGDTVNSTWSLEDVFNEVVHVLPGLCKRCNITLVSKTRNNQSNGVVNNNLTTSLHDSQIFHGGSSNLCGTLNSSISPQPIEDSLNSSKSLNLLNITNLPSPSTSSESDACLLTASNKQDDPERNVASKNVSDVEEIPIVLEEISIGASDLVEDSYAITFSPTEKNVFDLFTNNAKQIPASHSQNESKRAEMCKKSDKLSTKCVVLTQPEASKECSAPTKSQKALKGRKISKKRRKDVEEFPLLLKFHKVLSKGTQKEVKGDSVPMQLSKEALVCPVSKGLKCQDSRVTATRAVPKGSPIYPVSKGLSLSTVTKRSSTSPACPVSKRSSMCPVSNVSSFPDSKGTSTCPVSKGSPLYPVSKGLSLCTVSKGSTASIGSPVYPVYKGSSTCPISKRSSMCSVLKGPLLHPVSKGSSMYTVSNGPVCPVSTVPRQKSKGFTAYMLKNSEKESKVTPTSIKASLGRTIGNPSNITNSYSYMLKDSKVVVQRADIDKILFNRSVRRSDSMTSSNTTAKKSEQNCIPIRIKGGNICVVNKKPVVSSGYVHKKPVVSSGGVSKKPVVTSGCVNKKPVVSSGCLNKKPVVPSDCVDLDPVRYSDLDKRTMKVILPEKRVKTSPLVNIISARYYGAQSMEKQLFRKNKMASVVNLNSETEKMALDSNTIDGTFLNKYVIVTSPIIVSSSMELNSTKDSPGAQKTGKYVSNNTTDIGKDSVRNLLQIGKIIDKCLVNGSNSNSSNISSVTSSGTLTSVSSSLSTECSSDGSNQSTASPVYSETTDKILLNKVPGKQNAHAKITVEKSTPASTDKNAFDIFQKDLADVPLMANVDEVLVHHYILDLDVNFDDKSIDGNILLFIKPTKEDNISREFQMCLDCTLIDIETVEEISLPNDVEVHFHTKSCCCTVNNTVFSSNRMSSNNHSCKSCSLLQNYRRHPSTELKYQTLPYAVYGWCIRVWKESMEWPKCVHIKYRTKSVGPSLMWTMDNVGNPCAFTPGAYLNNRSMMPCQEPPVAMSTWQASITVPEGFIVLSSGDKVDCKRLVQGDSCNKFYFEMSVPLPSSTLAFAFCKFVRSSKVIPVLCSSNTNIINVSLYAAPSQIKEFEKEYLELSAKYLKSACAILGKYPFSRVDLAIMPRSFACLGLESPNLTFLSQSILCGDQSMSTRIAHEISHAWFGLLVGTADWTEEWLSEGFATYIEDRILAHAQQMNEYQFSEYSRVMQILRYRTLEAEIGVTEDDNLKRLRPKQSGNDISAVDAVNDSILDENRCLPPPYTIVPNAAVSSKKWSQVHYLKGYFLLLRMARMVGFESFDVFLKYYISVYGGQLVTSEMFFNLYKDYFSLSISVKEEIINQWMESTTLPIFSETDTINNSLVTLVEVESKFWKYANSTNKRCKTSGLKRKRDTFKTRPALNSNQLVLLLENLLLCNEFLNKTLTQMNQVYHFEERNSEVRHRWCELIIKHLYTLRYDQVKRFLIEDQGMGIYLFAELVITGNAKQWKLAMDVFELIKNEMDRSTFTTVREILFGPDSELKAGDGELEAGDGELEAGDGELEAGDGKLKVENDELNVETKDLNVGNVEVNVSDGDLDVGGGDIEVSK